ncbi:poliovirus receptor homolog [Mesocricetus auratus]|uniref:Poliovirus receptor homolog n=1 Tax=Mesocricetus auratus TaxID=10036 RepID=A0A1U8CMW7_MESAU|nr:poliovirus receptor homolog [Mesocricetus auratus]
MDRRTPLTWSLLPLLFALLQLGEPERAASGVAVQVLTNVTGLLNGTAYLLCSLTSSESVTVTQVTWMRKKPDSSPLTVAVFHPVKGPSITDPGRVEFLASRLDQWNASLSISHLRVEDEGNYECQFATFPAGSKSASVYLQVLVEPKNNAEPLEASPILKQQAVAKCISIGGRPLPKIDWLSDLNGTFNETHEPNTSIVTSYYSLVPSRQADGKNITCRVKHESLRKPKLKAVTLSVPYPPEVTISGYDDNWYVGRTGVALTCEAQSKPEPTSYEWSTATGPLPNATEPQGNRLVINTVDKAGLHNVTFICNATNALGSGQAQQIIYVKDPEQSGFSAGAIVGVIVGIICVVSVPAVVLWCVRSRRSRPKPSDTEYSPVNSNVNSAEDIEMNNARGQNQGA